ncbi:hypothetical protein [Cellulomonas iranensis]|uniref:hypothetical protein n=1 Tax=Cellulomonas iranensis TaxID=76862 RepID=UPI0013D43A6E|nr:hypothetical protein [Cellulomonas iranensis]
MTATTVEHPGPLLPGAPRFRLDLPDGWHAAPAPRALAVARPAVDVPGFQPNLTVTADLVPAGTTAAQVLDAMLAHYPGTRQPEPPTGGSTGDDAPDSDAPDGTARATLVRAHGTGTVHQRVDVHVDPTPVPGGHRHAVTVVSSWSATTPTDLRDALAAAHTSVRLGAADPAPA